LPASSLYSSIYGRCGLYSCDLSVNALNVKISILLGGGVS
jgi:hypothetical protein